LTYEKQKPFFYRLLKTLLKFIYPLVNYATALIVIKHRERALKENFAKKMQYKTTLCSSMLPPF